MKKILLLLLAAATLFSCKKKNTAVPCSMTVFLNGDSAWTTTSVQSDASDDYLTLLATNNSTKATLTLSLYKFDATYNNKTYSILTTNNGNNQYMNVAYYDTSGASFDAHTGQIVVTSIAANYFTGTFYFDAFSVMHVSGYFKAALP